MTDEEKALELVLAVDTTYSYLQIPVQLRSILEKEIAAALAAVREELETMNANLIMERAELVLKLATIEHDTREQCAKVAEGYEDNCYQVTELVVGKRIAAAIRQPQE